MSTIHVFPFCFAIIVIALDFHGFLCLTLSWHYHTITCDTYNWSLEQTTILRWISKTRTLDLEHFNPAPSLPFQAQNLELFCLVRSGLMMIQHYRGSGLIGCRRSGWLMLIFFSLSLTSAFDIRTWPACVLDVGDFFIRWLCFLDSCIVASNNSLSKVNSFLLLLGFCRWPHQHTFKMIWG